jgi:adenylate cyclase
MAIGIDPNHAPAYAAMGHTLIWAGRSAEVVPIVANAIRLSPRDPLLYYWYFTTCHSFTHLSRDDDAIEWCQKSIAFAYVDLASGYGWKGRQADAQAAVVELLKLKPNYTVQKLLSDRFSDDPIYLSEYMRIIEGVRKAGLPEE